MTRFFRLISAHRGPVTVDKERQVLAASADPMAPSVVPVVACLLHTHPGILFVTAEQAEPVPFSLASFVFPKASAMLFRVTGETTASLMHPLLGRFLTATPDAHAPLANTAQRVKICGKRSRLRRSRISPWRPK